MSEKVESGLEVELYRANNIEDGLYIGPVVLKMDYDRVMAEKDAEIQRQRERHRTTWTQLEQVTGLLRDTCAELKAWVDSFPNASHHQANELMARNKAALSQQAEPVPINQCDGCQAGVPVDEKGYHRMGKPGEYADLMYCERKRYVSEPAPAQDERLRAAFMEGYQQGIDSEFSDPEAAWNRSRAIHAAHELEQARPAQTAPQPERRSRVEDHATWGWLD